ncbi:MAG: hypothetical protein HC795_09745, partial [Coleofasciculaceae cyanobacterium RL_1_1]|nr:hypothetical protein [Coleofasciculaceae cyanobacterium RL_1_1]
YIWNSDRQKAFRAALLDVYRTYSELKIFVNDALEKNLGEIIGSNEGLEIVAFKLVDWADARKRLPDLYRYFCDDNPDHDFSNANDSAQCSLERLR